MAIPIHIPIYWSFHLSQGEGIRGWTLPYLTDASLRFTRFFHARRAEGGRSVPHVSLPDASGRVSMGLPEFARAQRRTEAASSLYAPPRDGSVSHIVPL